ncbi:MAG TPA: glucose 1-dehydrogenase [Candidatus Absconditabacterales bacterium]|nr:glucose 1-dehydrogenase [Candidatus Absconditabacterales bacterium]
MQFKDKIVLVTGASKGIGRSIALEFAKEGAKVVVNYFTSQKKALSVVEEIKDIGSEAIALQCDVSLESEVHSMINKIITRFGNIDILVNNAGIVFDVPFFEKTVDQWKRTLDVNLLGTYLCSKYASEFMLKNNGGKIINISSTNAMEDFSPDAVDYDTSKAGIIVLTRDLAKQLAPKIQVNAVAPGRVATDMNKCLPDDFIQKENEKIYLKRFAQPNEIANVVLFLASEKASFVNGSIIKVDGGR